MSFFTCKTMRNLVLSAAIMLLVGMVLMFTGGLLPTTETTILLPSITAYSGFFLLLLSPVVMLGTFLISLLPNMQQRLWECNH